MRVCAIQMAHGDSLDANLDRADALVARAAEGGARVALLPEYFFAEPGGGPERAVPHAARIRERLARASRGAGLALAANVIEPRAEGGFLNLGVVYDGGRLVLEQPKVHPMPREAAAGVTSGEWLRAADVAGVPTGLLVCADVLFPEAARVLQLQGARILLNPVMSPFRASDLTREARDAVFIARAYDSGAFVLKAGGFRRPAPGPDAPDAPPTGIAGRSLVAAPWGLLARYRDEFAEEMLFAELDLELLERYRESQARFPPRQPAAYRGLL